MGATIGIVDDDENICRALGRLLRLEGMEVSAFSSAAEFLASPARANFQCVLLDIHLGSGMSGFELRERMLDENNPTPVIFLTARNDAETTARARNLGCVAILNKGEDWTPLIELLRKTTQGT